MAIIRTRDLTKRYGPAIAVDQLSLSIEAGTIYGFVGLNGAGKTTAMRMLLGMIKPTSGTAEIFGKKCQNLRSEWKRVGYMIESTHAYPDLKVGEYLELFFNYYGLHGTKVVSEIIEKLGLQRYRDTRVKYLSLGNLQRLGLAKALMHHPDLLILDEPANGLDPAGMVEVRTLLLTMAQQGVTILISSHLLGEIAKIADQIGIIHEGKMIDELDAESLHRRLKKKILIHTSDNEKTLALLRSLGMEALKTKDGVLEIINGEKDCPTDFIAYNVVNQGIGLYQLIPSEEELESLFLRIIQSRDP
jgi:ABC-2 type transport system ATP-binding protein